MGLRLGIGEESTIHKGTGRLRPGRRRWVRGGGGSAGPLRNSLLPRLPARSSGGTIHLLRPPGLEGTCQLPGKGTLPISIPSTFARSS